jgi:uncharacterized repeat protein (TIGR03803 family)
MLGCMTDNPRSRSLGGMVVGGVIAVLIVVFLAALVILRQQPSATHATASAPATPAGAFQVLRSFDGYTGATPTGGVAYDPAAQVLYVSTEAGGPLSFGSIASLHTDGTHFEVLHKFTFSDGANPAQVPVLSSDGSTLFGVTSRGGDSGAGVLWSMNAEGTNYRVLTDFSASTGSSPQGPPLLSPNGKTLYGTTSASGPGTGGTVYRVNADGTGFRVLAALGQSPSQPASSFGQLTFDRDHTHLFGLSYAGGKANGGTLFRVPTGGHGLTVLHDFGGASSEGGTHPQTGHVVLGANGSTLYGLTSSGGVQQGYGTIFEVGTNGGGYHVLHRFDGKGGANPFGSLTFAPGGEILYGQTLLGGGSDASDPPGTIFSIRADGKDFHVLHVFALAEGGGRPFGDITVSKNGRELFGTASLGGGANAGSVFSYDLG